MAKFRTKPVEVDALLYTYPASDEMREFCGNAYYSEDAGDATHAPEMGLMIDDACHIVNEGDWVVKIAGRVVGAMIDNQFKAHYEPSICRLCNDTGMFYGNPSPCNCEASLRLQAEKQRCRDTATQQHMTTNAAMGVRICDSLLFDHGKAAAITHTAKSKTEDLRDILPRTFNNQSEDE